MHAGGVRENCLQDVGRIEVVGTERTNQDAEKEQKSMRWDHILDGGLKSAGFSQEPKL